MKYSMDRFVAMCQYLDIGLTSGMYFIAEAVIISRNDGNIFCPPLARGSGKSLIYTLLTVYFDMEDGKI